MFEVNKESSKHEVYLAIAHGNANVLKNANPDFLKDREYIGMLVKGNPDVLQYADPSLRDDEDIVRLALTNGGYGLKYASERLRHDEKFLTSVSKKNFFILDAIEDKELQRRVTHSVLIDQDARIVHLESENRELKRQIESNVEPEEILRRDRKIENQRELIESLQEIILSKKTEENANKLPAEVKPMSMAQKFRNKIASMWGNNSKTQKPRNVEQEKYDDEDMKIFNPKNSAKDNDDWEK